MGRHSDLLARVCAHALFGFSLSMIVRRILVSEPPFFPYALMSFLLLSLMLVVATKPEYTKMLGGTGPWYWADSVKFLFSILLLTLASTEMIGLWCCQDGMLNTIMNTEPPMFIVACFLALSTCGFVQYMSVWRYVVPIGVLITIVVSKVAPLIGFMFALSCGALICKTYYWRNR